MIITKASLAAAYTGFNAAFQSGFAPVAARRTPIVMETKSTTREETYPWMKDIPGFRPWAGDRVVNNIGAHSFTIRNVSFEQTVGVDRENFEDDQLGTYATLFKALGEEAAVFPDRLVFEFLKTADSVPCYDGQYLCDTDHPIERPDGSIASVSNFQAGASPPWFLMDLSRTLKPVVLQTRKPLNNLVRKDSENDDNVFHSKKFLYGSDGRLAVGAGLWQLIYMSRAALTPANYEAARAAFATFKKDKTDQPLGIEPTHLVFGGSNEGAARSIVISENATGGESNRWKGTAELLKVPYLA